MNRRIGLGLSLFVACLLLPAAAQAASGANWERAWGKDVDSVNPSTGFEICTVAANCKGGNALAPALGGELDGPAEVVEDSLGNLYVMDRLNQRVQKYDSNSNFLRLWGKDVVSAGPGNTGTGYEVCVAANGDTCKTGGLGSLAGELSNPAGITIDSQDRLYVTDGNGRIQKFDTSGNFLRAWGEDVVSAGPGNTGTGYEICVAANGDTCKAGSGAQTGNGGDINPNGIGVDSNDNVYVTDGSNAERIQKFDSNGDFLRLWGKDVVNGGGTGFEICVDGVDTCKIGITSTGLAGEFNDPTRIAVDEAGGVYVVDASLQRVQKFDVNGNFERLWGKDVVASGPGNTGLGFEICVAANGDTCKVGAGGGLAGEFILPIGVATDPSGGVYIGEQNGHRIQKFDRSGNFERAFGEDVVASGPGSNGTDFEICVPASGDVCKTGDSGGLSLGGEMTNPGALWANDEGTLFVGDGTDDRALKFAADPPPETTIAASPATFATATPSFEFSSDTGSTFQCGVDGGAFAACSSPLTTASLPDGAHTLAVRATDPARQVESTPATRNFAIDTSTPPPGDGGGGGGGDGGGGDGGGSGGTADTDSPETKIDSGPKAKRSGKATFEFSSDESGSTFECKLDKAAFERCSSPRKLKKLKAGKHTFQVRAIDAAGNEDATPAKSKFAIPAKRKRR